MKLRETAIAAVLSLLACGSPLLTGCSSFRGNIAFENALEKQNAGDYSGAISDYNKAIKINPKDADAFNSRGNIKIDLKDYLGAISDFNKAIEINSNDADAYYLRGTAKAMSREMKGACSDWEKASSLGNEIASRLVK